MGLILSVPEKIYDWTEKALSLVLINKNLTKSMKKSITDFISLYWKNRTMAININEINLSDKI